jgi:hypothetical protein
MRSALLTIAASAVLCGTASGATLDPRALVLREADVPTGFVLDPSESGYRSNAREAGGDAALLVRFKSWGRLNGYLAVFERQRARLESRAVVFRERRGARSVLAWYHRELVANAPAPPRRTPASIGDEAWVYRISSPAIGDFTLAVWRYDRVFAVVVSEGIPRARMVALARAQQRRILAALR